MKDNKIREILEKNFLRFLTEDGEPTDPEMKEEWDEVYKCLLNDIDQAEQEIKDYLRKKITTSVRYKCITFTQDSKYQCAKKLSLNEFLKEIGLE